MTTFITGNVITPITIGDMVHRIIVPTATVRAFDTAVTFIITNNPGKLTVAGLVSSGAGATSSAIKMSGNDLVMITQTGSVIANNNAIEMALGLNNEVVVAGHVYGGDHGIFALVNETLITITETGVVRGGSNRNGTDPSLPSAAITFGLSIADIRGTIENHGTIVGEENPTTGATIAVLNAMEGSTNNSLGFQPDEYFSQLTLINTGAIQGDIYFAAGDDTYDARGNGTVNGIIDMGSDDDVFLGGDADEDMIGGNGNDTIRGGGGDDTLSGGGGRDTMAGGVGDDSVSGGGSADTLKGNDGDDTLSGSSGADAMFGGSGDDTMGGGTGDDTMAGGGGDDTMSGNGGRDTMTGGRDDDLVSGGDGTDTVKGNSGDDTLNGGSGADSVLGGSGDDELRGNTGNDTMMGQTGDDDLDGGSGLDVLLGGSGNDLIVGGDDSDTLNGGTGNDTLIGGNGPDIYQFDNGFGQDVIEGFDTWAQEKIDLSGVSRIVNFSDLTANHLSQSGSDTIIDAGDSNTITLIDFAISDIQNSDFIF